MTQPEQEPRDLGSPVSFGTFNSSFGVDYSVRPVSAADIHPSEVDAAPKDSSAQESADSFSDLVPPPESVATAEKELQAELEGSPVDPALTTLTSPGDETPPAATPPLPPGKTRSSQSADKSS